MGGRILLERGVLAVFPGYRRGLWLPLLLLLVFWPISASSMGQPPPGPAPTKPPSSCSNVPFTLTATRLPPNYQGNDLLLLFTNIGKLQHTLQKDDFETSEEYEARSAAEVKKPILGSATIRDLLAFSFPPDEGDSKYNADAQEFTLHVPMEWVVAREWEGTVIRLENSPCNKAHSSSRTYSGQNAFGAKTEVASFTTVYNCLWIKEGTLAVNSESDLRDHGFTTRIGMTREKARNAKSRIRVLLVGRLLDRRTSSRWSGKEPTIAEPVQLHETFEFLPFWLKQVFIYNSSTGEVYTAIGTRSRLD